jgi:hypothetical protein
MTEGWFRQLNILMRWYARIYNDPGSGEMAMKPARN